MVQSEDSMWLEEVVLLLRDIAHKLSGSHLEREEYIGHLYASSKQGAAAVYGHMRARPATRKGKMPKHVQGGNAQVRGNIDKELAKTRKQPQEQNDLTVGDTIHVDFRTD